MSVSVSKDPPASIDPASTDPSNTDPSSTDPSNTDPSSTDPSNTDPASTDPSSTDPASTDPVSTDPSNTDPSNTDPASTDPSNTDPASTDPSNTDPANIDPASVDPASTDTSNKNPESKDPENREKEDGDDGGYMDMAPGEESPEAVYDYLQEEEITPGTSDSNEERGLPLKTPRLWKPPLPTIQRDSLRAEGDLDSENKLEQKYDTIDANHQRFNPHCSCNKMVKYSVIVVVCSMLVCSLLVNIVFGVPVTLLIVSAHHGQNGENITSYRNGSIENGNKPQQLHEDDWSRIRDMIQGTVQRDIRSHFDEYNVRLNQLEARLTSTLNDTTEGINQLRGQADVNTNGLSDNKLELGKLESDLNIFINKTSMHVSNFSDQFGEIEARVARLETRAASQERGLTNLQSSVNQLKLDTEREFTHVRTELNETAQILNGQLINLREKTDHFEVETDKAIHLLEEELNSTSLNLLELRSEFSAHETIFRQEVNSTQDRFTFISTLVNEKHSFLQVQVDNLTLDVIDNFTDIREELTTTRDIFNTQFLNLSAETKETFNLIQDKVAVDINHLTLQVAGNFTDLTRELTVTEANINHKIVDLMDATRGNFTGVYKEMNKTRAEIDHELLGHTQRTALLETGLLDTTVNLAHATSRVDQLEIDLSETKGNFEETEQRVGELETSRETLTSELTNAKAQLHNIQEYQSLYERKMNRQDSRISNLESDVRRLNYAVSSSALPSIDCTVLMVSMAISMLLSVLI